jgi:hypothetical protein
MMADDGSGPTILHVSGPDVRRLRTPDFVRGDLPDFDRILDLDEFQKLLVRTLLETYLAEFGRVADEALPSPPRPAGFPGMRFVPPDAGAGDDGAAGAGAGPPAEGLLLEALEGGELTDLDIEFEGPGAIGVAIRIGDPGDEPGAGPPVPAPAEEAPDVMVFVGEPGVEGDQAAGAEVMVSIDAQDISPEMRARLQEKARALAEGIRRQIEEAAAAGEGPSGGDLDPAQQIQEQRRYFQELSGRAAAFRTARAGLRQAFVGQVQAQLSPQQLQQWPKLERALVRRKTLPLGMLDGERTDLLSLAAAADLADAQRDVIAPTLEEYELALHESLLRRNAFLEESSSAIDKAIREGDPDRAISVADRAAELHVAVRTVNESFAESLALRLGAAEGAAFRARVLAASYPRVYRRTRAQRAFAAALAIEGLDDGLRRTISDLADAYEQGLVPLNESLRETIRRHQPRQERLALAAVAEVMQGGEPRLRLDDDPIRAALRRRSEHDERFMKQLYAMLPPEEVARLPGLPSEAQAPIVIRRSAQE